MLERKLPASQKRSLSSALRDPLSLLHTYRLQDLQPSVFLHPDPLVSPRPAPRGLVQCLTLRAYLLRQRKRCPASFSFNDKGCAKGVWERKGMLRARALQQTKYDYQLTAMIRVIHHGVCKYYIHAKMTGQWGLSILTGLDRS